jgi:hypothetical protein
MRRLFKLIKVKINNFLKKLLNVQVSNFNDNEIKSSAICRKLINNKDSIFLIAPISQKRYIKNEPLGMFIVLSENKINITNHIYNYDVVIPSSISNKLHKMFDNRVEQTRLDFEREIHGQVQHSLTTILEKLK